MGVSENSVPLNPMVLLIIIPIKWLFHWEYTLFSDKPIYIIGFCYSYSLNMFEPCSASSSPTAPLRCTFNNVNLTLVDQVVG